MHSIAGATQVKWAKIDDHNLATSHEGDVRIWDKRVCCFAINIFIRSSFLELQKSNTPIHYITAHLSKINGIDWNPYSSGQFVTCSQDGNIKVKKSSIVLKFCVIAIFYSFGTLTQTLAKANLKPF